MVSGTKKNDQMPMATRITPKKKYAPYPRSEIMYGVDLAMMNDPNHVSAVVKATQSMRMSNGKISEAAIISTYSTTEFKKTYHKST